jgi:drug/metabolite transporter (DMT)-like permease
MPGQDVVVSRRAWLLFAAVSLLWGIPYFLIKVAIVDLSPAFVVFGRTAIAAAVLVPLAAARGLLPALRGRIRFVVALAVVHVVAPFLLISYGELFVTSSLAGLIIAIEPVVVGLMLARAEPFTTTRVIGLVLGFGGVAVLTGVELSGGGTAVIGAGLVLLATLGYAYATILVQRHATGIPPTALVAGTQLTSTVLLAPVALFNLPSAPVHASSWSALVALGLLCTAVALIAFYALIGTTGPNTAGLVTYVNPLVAVALGVAVLHEPLRPSLAVGAVLILGGCWLSTRRATRRSRPADRAPETASLAAVDGS